MPAALAEGDGWISSWWLAGGLAVVGLLALCWGVMRRRRRRRAWPVVVLTVVAFLAAVLVGLNAYTGYVPNWSAAKLLLTGQWAGERGGHVTTVQIPVDDSLLAGRDVTYVYTPPGYDPSGHTRYPVLYLVHGTPGQSSDWFSAGGAAHTMDVLVDYEMIRPMIVVGVDANGVDLADTECLNSSMVGPQVETYLNDVVVPWVDAHYPTKTDWAHRSIGGMSMGGFCALDQTLRHQELYGSFIAIEPFDNPGTGETPPLTPEEVERYSPGKYIPTLVFQHPVPSFLAYGETARGGDFSETSGLADQLRARDQTAVLHEVEGEGHTWPMAGQALPYGLEFVSSHMP
jgi:enterochelin esterase-like enzyme